MSIPVAVLDWKEGKDYTFFQFPDEKHNIGICKHCSNKFTNRNYLTYQHQDHCRGFQSRDQNRPKIRKSIKEYFIDSNKQKEDELIKIVKYICENSIAINTTQSQTFKELFKSSFSEEKIRKGIIDYAEKMQTETKNEIKGKTVSIVIDGATINENSGWYAVGLSTKSSVFLYDIYHMASTTTIALTHKINEVIEEIQGETDAVVVGACSDNASNIANVFDPEHPEGLAQQHHKYLLRIPCQAHTANLVNATYARNNQNYNALRSKIKGFATKAAEQNIHISLDISKRCPLIREQRWYTEYDTLKWIINNRKKIEDSWDAIKSNFNNQRCPITDEWELLFKALKPLRYYVTVVEANICTIGRA